MVFERRLALSKVDITRLHVALGNGAAMAALAFEEMLALDSGVEGRALFGR
jgi:hypothetical protein